MFGYFKIVSLSDKEEDKDKAGASRIADVKSMMNENILGYLYLPPYLRDNQCDSLVGSVVVGYLDDVTGLGAAFCGINDADWGYFIDADVKIKKKFEVENAVKLKDTVEITGKLTAKDSVEAQNDIKSIAGDVVATTVSLKTHTHKATLNAQVETSTGSGTATGATEAPTT